MDELGDQSDAFLAEPLTRREVDILTLLGDGLSNREVADSLTLATSTVKWYTKQIYSKLGVNSREAAVENARALGLLDQQSSLHSLPLETTRFIGREAELKRIKRDLKDPGCRLLTIVGLGGAGKTRLAIRAAAEIAQENSPLFKDGVHFVPLAAQQDPDRLAVTIAGILDFPLSGTSEPNEQLVNFLRNKQMLLVLDNFEQLLEGAEQLAGVLRQAPRVKLLVTSREALNLSEEWRLELAGLPAPESTDGAQFEGSAVQLFVERASQVRADFSGEENDQCIAHICRLVVGVPLAVELAASWIRSLSCPDIASEIESNLDILEASQRNLPERHRSMRVVLDQSWSQLSQNERDVCRALSAFRGGFTFQAAKAIAGATPAVLTTLVDKSLVRRDRADRYQMHAILQKYAAEKLAENEAEARRVRDLHGQFFSALAFEHQGSWTGPDQLEAVALFKAEFYNLLETWQRYANELDVRRLDMMLESLCEFFFWRGRLGDGLDLCRRVEQRLSAAAADSARTKLVRAKALWWESIFITQSQNSALAKQKIEAAQEMLDSVDQSEGDWRRTQGHIWLQRGRTSISLGDVADAERYLRQSRSTFLELDEPWGTAAGWYWLGMLRLVGGHDKEMREAFERSLEYFNRAGDGRNIASVQDALAIAMRNMDKQDEALRLHRDALAVAKQIKDPLRVGWMSHNLTWTQWHFGDFAAGADAGQACLDVAEELGNDFLIAAGRGCLATCLLHLGQFERALALAEEANALPLKGVLWQPMVPLTLGEAALALGRLDLAREMMTKSSQITLEARRGMASFHMSSLVLATLAAGLVEEAEAFVQQALSLAIASGIEIQMCRSLAAAAAVDAAKGRAAQARALWAIANRSDHVTNSKWFAEIGGRFLDEAAAAPEPDAARITVAEAAAAYLEEMG